MPELLPEQIIEALGLAPHPAEGGFFRETWRSDERIGTEALPERYGSPRAFGTAIYYMLTPSTCSAMHCLRTDEIFHFYLGDPILMLLLFPDGASKAVTLGQDLLKGEKVQLAVKAGTWFGSFLKPGGAYALLGTTMAPGFEYADYEHGRREDLLTQYPEQRELILRLTAG